MFIDRFGDYGPRRAQLHLSVPNLVRPVRILAEDVSCRHGSGVPIWLGSVAAEPGSAGADDGVGSVGDLEFAEDVGDVVADGFWAEEQAAGDGGVVQALGDQVQDSRSRAQLG